MGRKRAEDNDNICGRYEISTGTLDIEPDSYRSGAYTLNINGVPSSHIVLGEPRELDFEYMRWIAAAVENLAHGQNLAQGKRIVHLGGGGCSLPRYFADVWPTSHNTVIELDAKLAELVRVFFDIPKAPRVKIRAGEARKSLEGFAADRCDVLIRDVFSGATTPRSLTTVEFFEHAKRTLSSNGLYIANCGDHSDLKLAKQELAGMACVFPHLAVIADPPMLKGRRYGNIILVGSNEALPTEGTAQAASIVRPLLSGAVPAHYKDENWTREFFAGASPLHDN